MSNIIKVDNKNYLKSIGEIPLELTEDIEEALIIDDFIKAVDISKVLTGLKYKPYIIPQDDTTET